MLLVSDPQTVELFELFRRREVCTSAASKLVGSERRRLRRLIFWHQNRGLGPLVSLVLHEALKATAEYRGARPEVEVAGCDYLGGSEDG